MVPVHREGSRSSSAWSGHPEGQIPCTCFRGLLPDITRAWHLGRCPGHDESNSVPLPSPPGPGSAHRLLNANKINCIRPNTFQDLQNLSLLSLYDNKIQSLAKGTFTSLRAIQTL